MSDMSSANSYLATGVAGRIDRGFATDKLDFDHFLEKWVPPTGSRVSEYQAKFTQVVEEFEHRHFKSRAPKVDIKAFHTWDEVLDQADSSRKAYEERARGLKGLASRIGRSVEDQSSVIAPALQTILPSSDYTSIVCGAVILVFQAFNAVAEVRKLVLNTLESAPPLLENVQRMLVIYPDNGKLHDSADELYQALLVATVGIIAWLNKAPWKRLAALIKQQNYESDLKDRIDTLKSCSAKLEEQSKLCDRELTNQIYKAVTDLQVFASTLVNQNNQLLATSGQISSQVQDVDGRVTRVGDQISSQVQNVDGRVTRVGDQVSSQVQNVDDRVVRIGGHMDALLKDRVDQAQYRADQAQYNSRIETNVTEMLAGIQRIEQGTANERVVELLSNFLENCPRQWQSRVPGELSSSGIVANISTEDVVRYLGDWYAHNEELIQYYATIASDSGPEIVAKILASPEFRMWFSSGTSHALIVEHDLVNKVTQPGSVVVASLCRALDQLPPAVYLVHFCCQQSEHGSSDPVGDLLACLVSTLLSAVDINLSKWSRSEIQQRHLIRLADRDIGYLCSLLKHLFRRLESGNIFILIDDFMKLERESERESLLEVFRYLQDLVAEAWSRPDLMLKILITTPMPQSSISARIRPDVCSYLSVAAARGRHMSSIDSVRQIYSMAAPVE